jgi:peroxiredoxin Q/BCP
MALEEGVRAPAFTADADGGKRFSLKDLRGSWVALYFYPEDDTPTCTAQACTFRDGMDTLSELGIKVVGVSPDDPLAHDRFKAKFNLNFTLVADPKHKLLNAYDVWKLKSLYGHEHMGVVRTTYLIDPKGIIRRVWTNVRHARHIKQITDAMEQLRAA